MASVKPELMTFFGLSHQELMKCFLGVEGGFYIVYSKLHYSCMGLHLDLVFFPGLLTFLLGIMISALVSVTSLRAT